MIPDKEERTALNLRHGHTRACLKKTTTVVVSRTFNKKHFMVTLPSAISRRSPRYRPASCTTQHIHKPSNSSSSST